MFAQYVADMVATFYIENYIFYEDVVERESFPHYWRSVIGHNLSKLTCDSYKCFSLVFSLNKILNKQSRCR